MNNNRLDFSPEGTEHYYREVFNSTNEAIFIIDAESGKTIDVNQAVLDIYGYNSKEEVLRTPIGNLSAGTEPFTEKEARQHFEKAPGERPYVLEWLARKKNGDLFWVEVSMKRTQIGAKDRILAVVRDISREKETQLALKERDAQEVKESRQLLRTVIDTVPARVFWKDLDLKFLGCNMPFARDAGMKNPDELIGKDDFQMGWKDQAEMYRKDDMEVIQSGVPKIHYEEPQTTPEGKKIWLKTSKAPLVNLQGETFGILGTYEDITGVKRSGQIQQALYGITNAVVFSDGLENLIREIREQLERLIEAPNFYIALYEEATGMLTIPYELDEKDSIETWPAKRSATGLVIEQKKTLLLKSADIERLLNEDVIDLIGTPSEVWLGVPLFDKDRVIGAIAVQSYTDPNAFDENTIQILEFVSSQVGLAIQQKRALNDILEAKEKAEENNRLKTAFLNNLSHEIRTPLNAIVGFSEFLNEPGLDPARIHHLTDIICRSSNQLLSIIEDIVNISKIEAGLIEAWEKETNVDRIISNVYDQLQIKAAEKEIKFRYNSSLQEPEAHVMTDETKLTQVLTNLVDNAIKFTEKGHVEFGCSLKDGFMKFYVADSGTGISREKFEIIFERFHQVETEHSQTKGGMGLGLPISKSFVEVLGGKIWVESTPGAGSIFFFTIPWKPFASVAGKAPTKEAVKLKDKQTILVAEDEENNFELTKVILSMYDVEILHAWDGQQALEMARDIPGIDLVLMDIKMPIMNGYDATREIKKIRPRLPIVALTAYALPGDREKALAAGCDDYMSKPISLKEFLTIVKKHS
jgi:PAS domain S-box-containing protein